MLKYVEGDFLNMLVYPTMTANNVFKVVYIVTLKIEI